MPLQTKEAFLTLSNAPNECPHVFTQAVTIARTNQLPRCGNELTNVRSASAAHH